MSKLKVSEEIQTLIIDAFQEGLQTKCPKALNVQKFYFLYNKSRTIKKFEAAPHEEENKQNAN